MTIVTRFAPSPTGLLHIGGARTALYNYLFAKKNKGIFKLRIEDTDKERSKSIYTEDILENMKWLGLNWDEKVVFQSDNQSEHKKLAEKLLMENKAYRCYSTREEIEEARNLAKKEKRPYKYNRKWRDYKGKLDQPHSIRIKIPLDRKTVLVDQILGKITIDNNELEDFIILRSDQTPTYMLSVVADDKLMKITDVIRGDDHLTNTFKQLILYDLFEWKKPRYSHIPLIHSKEGNKLSKRHGDLSVQYYKKNMFISEALINYLLRLGWSYGDKEFFSKQEAIQYFSLKGVGKSPAKFDENKLNFLNSTYFKRMSLKNLKEIVFSLPVSDVIDKDCIDTLLTLFQERSENINEFLNNLKYMFTEDKIVLSDKALEIINNTSNDILNIIYLSLSRINEWEASFIENNLKEIATNNGLKLFNVASPIRAAVTGRTYSPSIFKILEILGKQKSLKRIKNSF